MLSEAAYLKDSHILIWIEVTSFARALIFLSLDCHHLPDQGASRLSEIQRGCALTIYGAELTGCGGAKQLISYVAPARVATVLF